MAEIVTIGQNGTLSGTVYGTTDKDDASLPLVPPQLAAYAKQSQEDLFVSVSAGLATKYTATASCWRDFDVEKSSSGNSEKQSSSLSTLITRGNSTRFWAQVPSTIGWNFLM